MAKMEQQRLFIRSTKHSKISEVVDIQAAVSSMLPRRSVIRYAHSFSEMTEILKDRSEPGLQLATALKNEEKHINSLVFWNFCTKERIWKHIGRTLGLIEAIGT